VVLRRESATDGATTRRPEQNRALPIPSRRAASADFWRSNLARAIAALDADFGVCPSGSFVVRRMLSDGYASVMEQLRRGPLVLSENSS